MDWYSNPCDWIGIQILNNKNFTGRLYQVTSNHGDCVIPVPFVSQLPEGPGWAIGGGLNMGAFKKKSPR